ncbi:MerR family transcriptional regulator [Actinoplanes bogorensis]|uniref:MerR family transcriptional regulator n=1 Tax=Paractinoplanes bogorensis TaxID=1610840 RepID=A0ABS5YPU1_9ACTN|nr:MerR family transcriptional regulator [Actinoplanes bogorensis]MBU2665470.1 MerR family transcriptional regulator [Actinoplanes bogorensis]
MALLTIGAFARAARLTPKALRHYDESGLLRPAAVDAETGYRFYDQSQVSHARLIGRLREIGMPLAEIATVCALPPTAAADAVAGFWQRVSADAVARARLTSDLVRHLSGGDTSMHFTYAAATDIGHVRATNEDRAYAGTDMVAVADGSGGNAADVAIEALTGASPATLPAALEAAHRALHEPSVTTLTALLRDGSRLAVVHVGDTRAYLLRDGILTRLTQDHTWVQSQVDQGTMSPAEAAAHPQRALLSRALGYGEGVEADIALRTVRPGDRYLLCSDGLYTVVPALADTLAASADPQVVVDRLVAAALAAGAPDNVACAAYFSNA